MQIESMNKNYIYIGPIRTIRAINMCISVILKDGLLNTRKTNVGQTKFLKASDSKLDFS